MTERLPAALEAQALIRQVNGAGGFAMVIHKGEVDGGALLVVMMEGGRDARAWERMPQADGSRAWHCARRQTSDDSGAFAEYLERRARQDPDLWILELDIAQGERFIGLPSSTN